MKTGTRKVKLKSEQSAIKGHVVAKMDNMLISIVVFSVIILNDFITGNSVSDNCFCKLNGQIDNCSCTVETIDNFNNQRIYPKLQKLLKNDYFRYYKVNLEKKCLFWTAEYQCSLQHCDIEDSVPNSLKKQFQHDSLMISTNSYSNFQENRQCPSRNRNFNVNCELSYLNTSISQSSYKDFDLWREHDSFCVNDNDNDDQAQYVDLSINPERYTGYQGASAHRIWRSIYEENCFLNDNFKNQMCFEKMAFYRIVSGLHTSINVHLCANYLQQNRLMIGNGEVWVRNVDEFLRRFSTNTSRNGQGPQWLQNLYFIYLLELRALQKASKFFENHDYFTGYLGVDQDVQIAVKDVLNVIESFPNHFNESSMFNGGVDAKKLKHQFRQHFRNITRIMDCVECIKCRLWGKLQMQGLGTALNVLFSDKFNTCNDDGVSLERTEIVAFFNAFGKLSKSIYEIEEFRKLIRARNSL